MKVLLRWKDPDFSVYVPGMKWGPWDQLEPELINRLGELGVHPFLLLEVDIETGETKLLKEP